VTGFNRVNTSGEGADAYPIEFEDHSIRAYPPLLLSCTMLIIRGLPFFRNTSLKSLRPAEPVLMIEIACVDLNLSIYKNLIRGWKIYSLFLTFGSIREFFLENRRHIDFMRLMP